MTETQLKERLTADVDDVEAPADLVDRARVGGARRLRRLRLTAVAGSSLAVAAIAVLAVAVSGVRDRADQPPVATPTPATTTQWTDPITPNPTDRYAPLMTKSTGGDLAGDGAYLKEVRATWHDTQVKQRGHLIDPIAGDIWATLRGEPRIYWAGNSPAGRIAIVVQHYQAPRQKGDTKYAFNGIHTAVAMLRDDDQGRPKFAGFVVPYDDTGFPYFEIRDPGKPNFFVVVSMGKRLGWGLSPDKTTPFVFTDGVAVAEVPAAVITHGYISPLPAR
ncbi:hypothetical protein ACIA58_05115 [Kribbella sp. NPDC051586]|uniref:hypothetical protein n=1 Tax=Kribbella sp. NPDC051586 TaxID=3364118 RepID=UPI00378AC7A2